MKKVLYLMPSAFPGGAERATMRMLAAHPLSAFNRGVVFFDDGPLVGEARELGVATHLLTAPPRLSRPWTIYQAASECAALVTAGRYCLVHSCMSYTHLVGGLAASMAGVPAVLFQHGPVGSWTDGAATMVRCDHILVASTFMSQQQRQRSWRDRHISITPYSVDLSIAAGERAPLRAIVSAKHDIPPDAFVIGLLARFDPWKGIDFALRALAPLLRQRQRVRLMIVGGQYRHFYPGYGDRLRRIAEEEGILEQVIFAGFQLDVRPYYARLDALLHASIQEEPFGLTIVEGMAAEVPVVAADGGGPREIVADGIDGLLYEPANEAALRAAVMRLLDEPGLIARLVSAGAAKVEARYRAQTMMASLAAVYGQLCTSA